ncbi:hypothetical protein [Bounagaea algeriensis]
MPHEQTAKPTAGRDDQLVRELTFLRQQLHQVEQHLSEMLESLGGTLLPDHAADTGPTAAEGEGTSQNGRCRGSP